MSELKPSAYEFVPELPPPVFEGAPLPIREFQVRTVIKDSLFIRSDSLPEVLGKREDESIEDVVGEFERGDEPTSVKDGRLIGLVAAMTERGLGESTTLQDWQLAAHLGMLNALGAALSAGLPMSEDSLGMAMAFHREYSGRDAAAPDNDLYASPGADSAIQEMKRSMSGYGSMDFLTGEKGIERYMSYYMHDIDRMLYELPLTPEVLASYKEDSDTRHMVDACNYIITQVEATRVAVLDRKGELEEHLELVYERVAETQASQDARIKARGIQEELPGLEDFDEFSYMR
jgi:hypothetical protein